MDGDYRLMVPGSLEITASLREKGLLEVYEKAGFMPDGVFTAEANGRQCEFLRMIRPA